MSGQRRNKVYLIEYKRQSKGGNPYEQTITLKLLPKEFELISHALYFYDKTLTERFESYGEKEETKLVAEIAELDAQFSLINDFKHYGIEEIINMNKE